MNAQAAIYSIKAAEIHPCPLNPRKKVSEEELRELADSIEAVGMLQPITVRMADEGYEIVCGHRRYEAAKLAGMEEIPCVVRQLSDAEAYEIMVTENLQRKDIDPFEEAQAFTLLRERGYDVDTLTAKFGKSKSYVYSRLRLNNLIPELREKYEEGSVDISHCIVLSKLLPGFQKQLVPLYNPKVYNLGGQSVNMLKQEIVHRSYSLKNARFDTSACKNCLSNTACDALFLDMVDARCEDDKCFAEKTTAAMMVLFEKARELNPDFVIIDDWSIQHPQGMDVELVKELKRRGFKIAGDSWDYDRFVPEKGKTMVQDLAFIEENRPSAYAFGYSPEFLGAKKEKKAAKQEQYKDDWWLDRYAENYDENVEEIRNRMIEQEITDIKDDELLEMHCLPRYVLSAVLTYLVQEADEDMKAFGLEGSMDMKKMDNLILHMDEPQLRRAVAKFLVTPVMESGNDNSYFMEIFQKQYEQDYGRKIRREVYNLCKKNWHGYGEVTEKMVMDDLKERRARVRKEEDKS